MTVYYGTFYVSRTDHFCAFLHPILASISNEFLQSGQIRKLMFGIKGPSLKLLHLIHLSYGSDLH